MLGDELENLTLLGGADIDATGNDGHNVLLGNHGSNTLIGGNGNDVLDGGRGNDKLIGGAGSDTFRFSSLLDGSVDIIEDFNTDDDVIELDGSVFTALKGRQTFDDYLVYDKGTGKLSYDSDGKGIADAIHFATLSQNLDESKIHYVII